MGLFTICVIFPLGCALTAWATDMPTKKTHTNSLGMGFVRIEPGTFVMGTDRTPLPEALTEGRLHRVNGNFDEHPAHEVTITQPFYMGVHEVTNAQYEQFDLEHRKLRGKLGFATGDDEAVVFVSWHDAARFCEWLSERDGLPCRLPTEAEWEYACRAGSATLFHTGDVLPEAFHKNVLESWYPDPTRVPEGRELSDDVVPLTVGQTPPNAWGLYDMHGNVEEWCYDWYGPYEPDPQQDSVGRATGDFKVSRGGSHSTELYFLRSANRMGTLAEDKHWLLGFRVVLGSLPETKPLPSLPPERHRRNVRQEVPSDVTKGPDPDKPYFTGPRRYVKIPAESYGPLFSSHNHDPGIAACPNGDLLAIWYSTDREKGRELTLAASRLRYGEEEWEPASLFWDAPCRNDHAPALWFDGEKTLYHFVGLSAAATWGNLAVIMRTATDSGATWSEARIIAPEHGLRHQPAAAVFRARDGSIVLTCDANAEDGTALLIGSDESATWTDPGGAVAGIHGGVVQLKDGRLLAFGRGRDIDGKMPKSISPDMGKTWTFTASDFPPIGGGQRLALLRLKEGPIFFASFARETTMVDGSGNLNICSGLFFALSFDEGETWPVRRLLTPGGLEGEGETTNGRPFPASNTSAEPRGYLAVCQGLDGVIHLISSWNHYAFNLAWLRQSWTG